MTDQMARLTIIEEPERQLLQVSQKQLRLQEARRLLMAESADAADVAFRVGYESASQFSREYARMFGGIIFKSLNVMLSPSFTHIYQYDLGQ